MDKLLKNKNGITLSMLVITVIVLGLLAAVTINISKDSLTESKKYNFVSELEIIQQKMLVINKEVELGTTAYDDIGTKYDELNNTTKQQVQKVLNQNGVSDYSEYVYMTSEDLSKIGLKNIKQSVIISYGKSIVYSYEGININGNVYYSIGELKSV